MDINSGAGIFLIVILTLLGGIAILWLLGCVRYIGNNRIAVVEKLWSSSGSIRGGIIALKGEAGYQPDVLRGGLHFFAPLQFRIHVAPLVTIPQGSIGYIFARDGQALRPDQTLASNLSAYDFQDTRNFLLSGGQKGPQRTILREGSYAINLAQFVVITQDQTYTLSLDSRESSLLAHMSAIINERDGFSPVVIKDADDIVGVVTVHDGPGLASGEIIAPTVGNDPSDAATFHNSFQDPEKFLAAGGRRGRQLHVLVEGTYYIKATMI